VTDHWRRLRGLAVGLCLVGAVLAYMGSGRPYASALVVRPPAPVALVTVSGRTISPATTALALLALAGVAAILAVRGWVLRAAGLVLVATGTGIGYLALGTEYLRLRDSLIAASTASPVGAQDATVLQIHHTAWPLLTALGGVCVLLAGIVVVAGAGRWSTAVGARYERHRSPASDPWTELDAGGDPTLSDQGDDT
jgi:uncharacterized membrane protein (TIGR02234 family)